MREGFHRASEGVGRTGKAASGAHVRCHPGGVEGSAGEAEGP